MDLDLPISNETTFCLGLSIIGALVSYLIIPSFYDMLINAKLFGKDMGKPKKNPPVKVPEAVGVIIGMSYLVIMTIFIPFEYEEINRHQDLIKYLGGLLAICWMILLGFVDDVLDLKWRHKVWIPTVASLPLLIVYYMRIKRTEVILPLGLNSIDLGWFYYIYMGMLAIFCTNSINIYAGINGLEVGQSIVIGISIIIFNLYEKIKITEAIDLERSRVNEEALLRTISKENTRELTYNEKMALEMDFSLNFMIPFVALSLVLFSFNKYPSKVFVGDTYCYFAGMSFAVVGILAHFSKTLLLFFLPQILNFVLSVPQLFKLINCPRHRLPKYDESTDLRDNSYTDKFKLIDSNVNGLHPPNLKQKLVKLIITFLEKIKFIKVIRHNENMIQITNLTLINVVINFTGKVHEKRLTNILLLLQAVCSVLAFVIRYKIADLFY